MRGVHSRSISDITVWWGLFIRGLSVYPAHVINLDSWVFVFPHELGPFHAVNNLCVTAPIALCHISGPPHPTDLFLQRFWLVRSVENRKRKVRVGYGFKRHLGYTRETDYKWQQAALFYRLFQGVESMTHNHFYWKRSCGMQLIDRKMFFSW